MSQETQNVMKEIRLEKVVLNMGLGKSGDAILRRDDEFQLRNEVIDALLPGKASKLQVMRDRTLNQHRWTGREYQGA